jgi:lipopolysaccharide exporter
MVAIPAALGLALVAAQAVPLLLGDKWLQAIPLLRFLALVGFAQALTAAGSYVMLVLGNMVHAALVFWGQVLLFVLLILLVLPVAEAVTIAALRLAAALASIVLSFWLLR